MTEPTSAPADTRPYSPGLEGVIAGETTLSFIDGAAGRLLYRGYPIGELVQERLVRGDRRAAVDGRVAARREAAVPAGAGRGDDGAPRAAARRPADGRAADRGLGLGRDARTPPGRRRPSRPARSPRSRRRRWPRSPGSGRAWSRWRPIRTWTSSPGYLYQVNGERPDDATARALDAYFIVGAEHGFNASTFTCRVITSTRADIASAVCGAIGAMKGPLHGGAPSEVVEQIHEVGTPERAEAWVRDAIARRRPADGLRASRVPRLRPAGGGAARGRRGHGAPAGLAGARDRRRGRRAAGPRREVPGPAAQDERGVLRGAGADGRRASRRTCSRPRSRSRATPAGRPTRSSRAPTTG